MRERILLMGEGDGQGGECCSCTTLLTAEALLSYEAYCRGFPPW